MSSTDELLADRYGRRPKASVSKNRRLVIVLVALTLAVIGVWAFASQSAPTDRVSLVFSESKPIGKLGYVVSGKVSRPAAGVVRCALQVQALDFSVVGYREVTLAAGVTDFDTRVFSVAPGVNASVTRCWLQ